MKNLMLTMAALPLLASLSGCLYSPRDWEAWQHDRRDRYGDRDQDGNGNRPDVGRDCWMRNGQRYCRDGN